MSPRRTRNIVALVGHWLGALLRDSWSVARVVLTPGTVGSAVVAVPLRHRGPWVVTTYANLVSLTPGTITVDVADDRSELYVHLLTTHTLEQTLQELEALQDRLLEAVT